MAAFGLSKIALGLSDVVAQRLLIFLAAAFLGSTSITALAIALRLIQVSGNWRSPGSHELDRGTAGKDFNGASVGWKERNEAVGQAAFAAHPRDEECRH